MLKEYYGLMGCLYNALNIAGLVPNRDVFFDEFLCVDVENSQSQPQIRKYDYFAKSAKESFEDLLCKPDIYIEHFNSYFVTVSEKARTIDQLKKELACNDKSKFYSRENIRGKNINEDALIEYDITQINRLRSFINIKDLDNSLDLGYIIYEIVYLAIYKKLSDDFGNYSNFDANLAEFNNKVTCRYGVTSTIGTKAIIHLALTDPSNIIALYEYADMLYYGRVDGVKQDIPKAYLTYKKLGDFERNYYHPLAAWSLAYILYNYDKNELKNIVIPEVEEMDLFERYDKAVYYALYAYSNNNNPAAANILGKISELAEDDDTGMFSNLKNKNNLLPAIDYFNESIRGGYIYAHGSLSNYYLKELFRTTPGSEQEKIYLYKYIEQLNLQSDSFDHWAGNKLGRIYLTGNVSITENNNIIKRHFPSIVLKTKAYNAFFKATKDYTDDDSIWAYVNLILYFPDLYANDFTEKLLPTVKIISNSNNQDAKHKLAKDFRGIYQTRLNSDDYAYIDLILKGI